MGINRIFHRSKEKFGEVEKKFDKNNNFKRWSKTNDYVDVKVKPIIHPRHLR